jgi:hypothetical protein
MEAFDLLLAETLDVEAIPRDEVFQPLDDLRAADESAGAAPVDFALLAHRVAAADGASLRELILSQPARLVGNDPDDLRDNIAGALDDNRIADADVLAFDLVFVVQGRIRDDDPADRHRLQPRNGRQLAGAAHLNADVL